VRRLRRPRPRPPAARGEQGCQARIPAAARGARRAPRSSRAPQAGLQAPARWPTLPFAPRALSPSWLRNSVTTGVVAVTIGGSAIVALTLVMSVVRAVERGLLLGAAADGTSGAPGWGGPASRALRLRLAQPRVCVRSSAPYRPPTQALLRLPTPADAPPPWLFTGYRAVAAALNLAVWLLLVACVGVLGVMAAWWGAFAALHSSLEAGVAAGEAALSALGLSVGGASDASALLSSALAGTPLASVVAGGGALPFAPVCAPVCLNAGSFAQLLRMRESCVCGSAALDAARGAAAAGARGAGVGLAGAAAVWLASCLLLLALAGHYVTAGFDRKSAAYCRELRAEAYERGYRASPADLCAPADVVAAVADVPRSGAADQALKAAPRAAVDV
jgi:hypothetical protein